MSNSSKNDSGDYMYTFLASIQLESFLPILKEKLQITRVSHFDYVKAKDLEKIGMSKPAIRRLLDAISRNKKLQMPTRSAPAPPNLSKSTLPLATKPLTSNNNESKVIFTFQN